MANPNRTVADWRAKVGADPKVVKAREERQAADPMVIDMGRFQRGEMTADEFARKWKK